MWKLRTDTYHNIAFLDIMTISIVEFINFQFCISRISLYSDLRCPLFSVTMYITTFMFFFILCKWLTFWDRGNFFCRFDDMIISYNDPSISGILLGRAANVLKPFFLLMNPSFLFYSLFSDIFFSIFAQCLAAFEIRWSPSLASK